MKKLTFGVFYTVYGNVTVYVPDDITDDNVIEYLEKHIEEYPRPTDISAVNSTCELDKESIEFEED